jgi:hypothetical protein
MEFLGYVGPLWAAPVIPISITGTDWNNFLISQQAKSHSVQEHGPVMPQGNSQPRKGAEIITKFRTNPRKRKEDSSRNKEKKEISQQEIDLDRMPLIGQAAEEVVDDGRGEVEQDEEVALTISVADWVHMKISRNKDKYLSCMFRRGSLVGEEDEERSDKRRKGDYETLP